MGIHDFDAEYRQHRIETAKRQEMLEEIRDEILVRAIQHKDYCPAFDVDDFMTWWDRLSEWTKRRHRDCNTPTLIDIRCRETRPERWVEKDTPPQD